MKRKAVEKMMEEYEVLPELEEIEKEVQVACNIRVEEYTVVAVDAVIDYLATKGVTTSRSRIMRDSVHSCVMDLLDLYGIDPRDVISGRAV